MISHTSESVSEQFLNGTSADKRPFSTTNVLSKSNYVEEMRKQMEILDYTRNNNHLIKSATWS